jgi:plasmid stabilization system protein ParE
MRVHWTDTAQGHLRAIHNYIKQDSPEYARRTVDRLTRRSVQIAQFPRSGRKVPEYESDEIREVIEAAYRVIYRIKPDQIDVLAVIHGARDLARATATLPGSDVPRS